MAKLKLGALADDKPVRLTIDVPAMLHRELLAYADLLARETGSAPIAPAKLIVPMVERFIATDRGFTRLKRESAAARPDTRG